MSDRNLVHYEEERNEHGPYWTLDIDRSATGTPGLFFTIRSASYLERDRNIEALNRELSVFVKDGNELLAPVLAWLAQERSEARDKANREALDNAFIDVFSKPIRNVRLELTDGNIIIITTNGRSVGLSVEDEEDLAIVTLTNAQRRQLIHSLGGRV